MKAEEREQISGKSTPPPGQPQRAYPAINVSPSQFGKLASYPGKVTLTRQPTNQADILATQQLLDSTIEGDHYKCPRCEFVTGEVEPMLEHLAYEINKALQFVADLSMPGRSPRPETPGESPTKTD